MLDKLGDKVKATDYRKMRNDLKLSLSRSKITGIKFLNENLN